MECKNCKIKTSCRFVKGYCNACYQRLYKTGNINLKCLTGTHAMGASKHPLYSIWSNMKTRCYNPNSANYARWGGRGIKVCDRWLEKPNGFWNFVSDMGGRPVGTSLDRIDDNGDYCKDNCRWATPIQQSLNRRKNNLIRGVCKTPSGFKAFITYCGKTYTKRFPDLLQARQWRLKKEKEFGLKI